MGSVINNRPASGTSFLKGSIDASLAANLPSIPQVGDLYDVSVAGSFENDALILPAGAYFSVPDQVRWNGTNWVKMEAGDNISDAAFDASWDGNVNNAPSKNAVYDAVNPHITSTSNPHSVTKTQVGLGNVTDDAQLKIASNLGDLNSAATARTNLGLDPYTTKVDQQDAVKTVSTQTYSIIDTDHGKTLFFDYAGAVTITCPQSLTSTVHVTCVAEGASTTLAIAAGSGATFVSKDSKVNVTARYGVATLVHKGSNAWFGFGNLE